MFNEILLIDDNEDDNFIHTRLIQKNNLSKGVTSFTSGLDALDYLKNNQGPNYVRPDIIFLDVNMPEMDGWEFIERYNAELSEEQKSRQVVVLLTTSDNPDDIKKSHNIPALFGFNTKPLTPEMISSLMSV